MDNQINDLQKRIADLKAETQPSVSEQAKELENDDDKQGLSAAYEMIMTPIVCGGIGLGLDKLFSTAPVFFISLAILGLLAGFWRIYRLSNNIHTPLDLKRLQESEKKGRKAQISENKTEES